MSDAQSHRGPKENHLQSQSSFLFLAGGDLPFKIGQSPFVVPRVWSCSLLQPDLSPHHVGSSLASPLQVAIHPVPKLSVLKARCCPAALPALQPQPWRQGHRCTYTPGAPFTSSPNLLTLRGTLQARCLGGPHPRTGH